MTRLVCARVVCLCVLAASLFAAWGCRATKQSYVQKGNKLFAAGQYEGAALNYRAAIQKDAGYGEAYYRFGLTAIKLKQVRPAYESLLRAVQLLPGNVDAKKKFTDVCLSLYLADPSHPQALYNEINKFSDEFIASHHHSYQGWMLKGYLASTDQKPKQAIEYFRTALRVNSSDDGVVTELAHLLIQDGESDEGRELAANLIARHTAYGPAYDLLYAFYLQNRQPAEAESVLEAKVNNNPKNADYVFDLAAHYHRTQNQAAMTAALQRLLDHPADFPQARLWIGDFYLRLRSYDQAISNYHQGEATTSDAGTKVIYQLRNVLALMRQGKQNDALRLAIRCRHDNPKDDSALRMRADLLLARGRAADAALIARDFQSLSSRDPNDTSLHLQLGRALRFQGDWEGARKQFVEAVHQRPDLDSARYELANITLIEHRPQEALEQASALLRAHPTDRQARLLYATSLTEAGQPDAARAALATWLHDFPQDAALRIQLGLLAFSQRNFAETIQILGQYRASGDARTFEALATAYAQEKQLDQALAILNEGLARWPASPVLLERLADTETRAGHYDVALAQYQKLLSSNPGSIELRDRLAHLSDLEGDHARALAYYQEAHRLAPDEVLSSVSLADALASAGRVDEARTLYRAIAKSHPENAPALNNAAYFLADTGGDLDEALRLATTALAKIPGQPSFSDTIAYIYLKKGMLDSAIQSFSTLAHRYPASASFHYHLGLALFQKGQKAVARKELQTALSDHPTPQETLRIRELLNEIS